MLGSCLLGIAVGCVLIVLPSILHREHVDSVFDLIRSSLKNMPAWYFLLLLAGGFFWGLALKWPYSFWAAVCQVASLPLFAVIEMIKDPTSHNLWPFEFLIYGVLTVVPLTGWAGAWLVKRMRKTTG